MRKFLFGVITTLVLLSRQASAQEVVQLSIFPDLTGNELLDSLFVHYAPTDIFNYNNARDLMYSYIDNEDGTVYCIYTGDSIPIDPNSPTPRGDALEFNWNTEHIWPQSRGAGTGAARTDIHHLRPIRADVNTSRSNFPFAFLEPSEVNRWWKGNANQTETPSGDLGEWSRTGSQLFQVFDEEKGFTARAMFYFYTFYPVQARSVEPDYFVNMLDVLRAYHDQAQVTASEVDRTMRLQEHQGNFNPFIMDTTLVRRAFFENYDPGAGVGGYIVDFETGTKNPSGYTIGTVTLEGIEWTFSNSLIGGDAGDEKLGLRSARLRHQTSASADEAFIQMNDDKTGGLGTVSFLYSRSNFGGDRTGTAPVIRVEYSTDQGQNWSAAGADISLAGVNELTSATRAINIAGDGRVRIRVVSGGDGKRLNIDNFRITDFSNVVLPTVTANIIGQVTFDSIEMTSSVESEGGGTVTERGFIYAVRSENSDPVLGDDDIVIVTSGAGTGVFSETLTGLEPETEYVIKAYATNETGTIYNEEDFITTPAVPASEPVAFFDDFNQSQGSVFTTDGPIGSSPWSVNRSGEDWGARIFDGILELTNTASPAANQDGWVFAYTETSNFEEGFTVRPDQNMGIIRYSFNMRQIRSNPAGFGANSYGAAFVLGTTDVNAANAGSGYAVVLGNTGTPDPLRLVQFTGGLQSLGTSASALITADAPLDDPINNHMSIEVTWNSNTGEWRLYGRNDLASFDNPQDGDLVLLGSTVSSDFSDIELNYLGAYWQGSFANNQTAFFDNVRVAVEPQEFVASTTIYGTQGWRMVGSPVSGLSVSSIFDSFWTQGFPGAKFSGGSPNVFFYDVNSGQFQAPVNAGFTPEPGAGMLFYTYEKDDNQTGSFPKNWEVSGIPVVQDVEINLNPIESGFTLVANPFHTALDWGAVLAANRDIKPVVYVYDHAFNGGLEAEDIELATGGYRTWNGIGGGLGSYQIAPFQAFWVESDVDGGILTIPASARNFELAPGFYNQPEASPRIRFQASINGRETQEAWITFGEDGSADRNKRDAYFMGPLEFSPYVQFAFEVDNTGLSVKHLPDELHAPIEVPVDIRAWKPASGQSGYVPYTGELELKWEFVQSLPDHWEVILVDNQTGAEMDLRKTVTYRWEFSDKHTGIESIPYTFGTGFVPSEKMESRFQIVIQPTATSAGETGDLPKTIALGQNYPNPFNPVTTITYQLPEQSNIRLEVFNITGQRVATLVNGEMPAGNHFVNFSANNLASGVYVYRLHVNGATVLTRKMMLLK